MAQRVYWNWEDDDLTRDLSRYLNGYFPSGVYRGFELGTQTDMDLKLIHTATGFLESNTNQDAPSNSKGLWRSLLGASVVEDSEISIPIAEADPTNPRIDLIIGSHTYVQATGGQPAFYAVVSGTPGVTPVAPAIPNEVTDIIIGTLYIPAGIVDLSDSGVIWTRANVPHFAASQDDFNHDNNYTSNNYINDGDNRKTATTKLDAALKVVADLLNTTIATATALAITVTNIGAIVTAVTTYLTGGTTGQVLKKLSNTNYHYGWVDPPDIADTGWIAATLANNWNDTYSPGVSVFYRKKNGIVYLQGHITGNGDESSTTMFTLPAGYRPSLTGHGCTHPVRDLSFARDCCIFITTGGLVVLDKPSYTLGDSVFIDLSAVSFIAEI